MNRKWDPDGILAVQKNGAEAEAVLVVSLRKGTAGRAGTMPPIREIDCNLHVSNEDHHSTAPPNDPRFG